MNYTQSNGEKSTVNVTVTFTENEWQDALSRAYLRVRRNYSAPGFRKGKVPRPVLENYYGKSVLFEDALNLLCSDCYPEIIEKEKEHFTAVGDPSFDVKEFPQGNGVVLSCIIPVKPDVTIEQYKGLKIKKYEYNVTEADVEREVKRLLERNATDVEVTGRPCEMGDTVNIDFSGSVAGEFFPGGTAEDYNLVLGSGSFIPGFEEGVAGMSLNEEKTIQVKFPEDYQADNLKGKDADFKIKLNKITAKQLPELTDEYVKKNAGADSVEAYKSRLKENLENSAKNRSRDETETSIIKEICNHATCELPDAMIESEIDGMVNNFANRLKQQGLSLEDYVKYMQLTMADFRAQFKEQATERALSQLVIDKIIKLENIKLEDGELDAKIEEYAKAIDKTADEYKKMINEQQKNYIASDIVITKLFDFLTANNELYTEGGEEKPAPKKTTAKKTESTEEKPAAKKTTAKKTAAKKTEE